MSTDALTPKQRAFVDHYLKDPNATEAARLAGYSGSNETLRQTGSENLTKPHIKAAIEERQNKADKKRVADANEVLEILTSVARGEVVAEPQRVRACELLGRRYLLWKERDGEDLPPLGAPAFDPLKS